MEDLEPTERDTEQTLDVCENPQATGRSNYSITIANAGLEPMEAGVLNP